jgi:hypothetical protein
MTTRFYYLLVFGLLFLFPAACKKGENDPLISLRTRKDRVAGDWRLTGGSATRKVIRYKDPFIYNQI